MTSAKAICTLAFVSAICVSSQEKQPAKSPLPSPQKIVDQATADASTDCNLKDPASAKACNESVVEKYRYLIAAYRHRRESFDWNLKASRVMFVMVILLVVAGMLFATVQFRIAMLRMLGPKADGNGKTGIETDLEISAKGVKVSSSVLGIIILLISMSFFYLYALYVYPIHEVHYGAEDVVQGQQK